MGFKFTSNGPNLQDLDMDPINKHRSKDGYTEILKDVSHIGPRCHATRGLLMHTN